MSDWVIKLTDYQEIATDIERTLNACGYHEAANICRRKLSQERTVFLSHFSDKKKGNPIMPDGTHWNPDIDANRRGNK